MRPTVAPCPHPDYCREHGCEKKCYAKKLPTVLDGSPTDGGLDGLLVSVDDADECPFADKD